MQVRNPFWQAGVLVVLALSLAAGPVVASHLVPGSVRWTDTLFEPDARLDPVPLATPVASNADIRSTHVGATPTGIRFDWHLRDLVPETTTPTLQVGPARAPDQTIMLPGLEPSVHYRIRFDVPEGFTPTDPAMFACVQSREWFVFVNAVLPEGPWLQSNAPSTGVLIGIDQTVHSRWPFDTPDPMPFHGAQTLFGAGCILGGEPHAVRLAASQNVLGGFESNPTTQVWFQPPGHEDEIRLYFNRAWLGIPYGTPVTNLTTETYRMTLITVGSFGSSVTFPLIEGDRLDESVLARDDVVF